jgi:hypothetical protein
MPVVILHCNREQCAPSPGACQYYYSERSKKNHDRCAGFGVCKRSAERAFLSQDALEKYERWCHDNVF